MKVTEITSEKEFAACQDDWNTLLGQCSNNSVFLRHEWFLTWWKNYGEEKKLLILLVWENNALIGVAPLMLVAEKTGKVRPFKAKVIRFIENGEAPHADFIVKGNRNDIFNAIFRHLEKRKQTWDIMMLNGLPADSFVFGFEEGNRNIAGLKFHTLKSSNYPILEIDHDWETFFLSKSKRFRGAVRNTRNKVRKLGEVRVEKLSAFDDSENALEQLLAVSKSSWKNRINASISCGHNRKNFFSELTRVAAKNGWLSLWLLSIDNRPIAFEYHLNYHQKVYALCSEFNEEFQKYSPGLVLDSYIVERMCDNGGVIYDMGACEDPYKMRWTDNVQAHKELFVFNNRISSRLLYLIECRVMILISQMHLLKSLKRKRVLRAKKQ